MMKWSRLAAAMALASAFLVAQCPAAWADDGYMGAVGSSVAPMQNDQVTMTAERIDALISGDQTYVTCVFTFTNGGPPDTVLMGFPQLTSDRSAAAAKLLDFTAEADGKAMHVTFKQQAGGSPDAQTYAGWYTFSIPFMDGQTRTVRNTYRGRLSGTSNGDRDFYYVLHTGATWLGPIGQVDVNVRWLHDRDVLPETVHGMPAGYDVGQHAVHWHFTTLKPTQDDDILLHFRPAYGLPNAGGRSGASTGEVPTVGQMPNPPPSFADGNPATAWHSSGEAAGAWLAWVDDGYPMSPATNGMGILPGMVRSKSDFEAHGRPKQVLVKLAVLKPGAMFPILPVDEPLNNLFDHHSDGIEIIEQSFTLNDSPGWQFLTLPQRADARAFQVIIQSVYPGSRYNDVAISEMLFPLLPDDVSSPPGALPATGLGTWQWTTTALVLLGLGSTLAGFLLKRGMRLRGTYNRADG